MANDTRTNGSQFFIALADLSAGLPPAYTIFGQVTSGLDVLDRLSLLDLTTGTNTSVGGDTILSISIDDGSGGDTPAN